MEKLNPKTITGQKEKVMAPLIAEALERFCGQNEEFRAAIEQGESFQKCMTEVARGAGSSISDADAIKKAVEFYFKGAKVHFDMRIELEGDAPQNAVTESKIISLEDFL